MDSRSRYITSSEDAEHFAAARMREMGFPDARVTGLGADGGIDVVARRAVAQVKWMHQKVTRPDLQRLYGARGAEHLKDMLFFAELISPSPYTAHAVEYANEHGIGLFAYTTDGNLFPQNQHARDFTAGIERVRTARAAKQARLMAIHSLVWAALLIGSICGMLVSAVVDMSAIKLWIVFLVLSLLGLALSRIYRPMVD
ncbi:restriction endonuclease [Rhodococcus sp. A5(2022)]|uniref:restriction endonuclease n=1 Tax=Rhodococcus sp. A5(2022) TaxID=3003588 RepID=UPI0022A81C8D|nr:restriction endonuclease [Rhodococcus sp. A5(2022)]MCZ1073305.1 restriction endonuclease [Rhodococcus sp. A5(2022)]